MFAARSALEELLEQLADAMLSQVASARHGDKSVTYRSVAELRRGIGTVRELERGKKSRVVAVPGRPKL